MEKLRRIVLIIIGVLHMAMSCAIILPTITLLYGNRKSSKLLDYIAIGFFMIDDKDAEWFKKNKRG